MKEEERSKMLLFPATCAITLSFISSSSAMDSRALPRDADPRARVADPRDAADPCQCVWGIGILFPLSERVWFLSEHLKLLTNAPPVPTALLPKTVYAGEEEVSKNGKQSNRNDAKMDCMHGKQIVDGLRRIAWIINGLWMDCMDEKWIVDGL